MRRPTRCFACAALLMKADPSSSYVIEKTPLAVTRTAKNNKWRSKGPGTFDSSLFPNDGRHVPSSKDGAKIVLPDFDVLFSRIAELSPLAKQVLENRPQMGFDCVKEEDDAFKWRSTDYNKNRNLFSIEKIDNFGGIKTPLMRFRSHMRGPKQSRGERFSHLLTDFDARSRWDMNLADIYVIYPVADMDGVNAAMGAGKYGETTQFGLGYCRTKQNVVSPREQLTLCGLQEFESGASIVWGVEMEDDQNHLLPGEKWLVRSRTHIFSTTLVPTGDDTFDCEYVLQLEIGDFPAWLAGPVLAETVKGLFRFADKYFEGGLADGELAKYLEEERKKNEDLMKDRQTILMTP